MNELKKEPGLQEGTGINGTDTHYNKQTIMLSRTHRCGQAQNAEGFEPVAVDFSDTEILKEIFKYDFSPSVFKDGYRRNENFTSTNLLSIDIDEGVSISQFRQIFKDYRYILATSRNHQKTKKDKPACDRFHAFFPVHTITDAQEVRAKLKTLSDLYPFIDKQATDAARFFYGNPEVQVYFNDGKPLHVPYRKDTKEAPASVQNIDAKLFEALKRKAEQGAFNDRNEWVRLGMALKAAGYTLEVFQALSWPEAQNEAARQWQSFKPEQITERTLYYLAGIENEAEPQLKLVDLTDLESTELEAPQFVVNHILPRGVATMLASDGGKGKSILALVLAACVAEGRHWAGLEVEKGRVLFVTLEDDGKLVKWRLQALCREYGLSFSEVQKNLTILDGADTDGTLAEEIQNGKMEPTTLWHEIEKAGTFDFIVVDNASDAFGGNENQRRQVRFFIRLLTKKARKDNAALLLLAHVDKSAARTGSGNGSSYSGSTAWNNSVRSRLALLDDKKHGLALVHEKSNFGKRIEPIPLTFSGCVVVPQSFDSTGQTTLVYANELYEAIKQAIAKGARLPANRGAGTNFYSTLKGYGLPEGMDKETVYQALNELLDDGRVKAVDVKIDYKMKTIIVLSANPPLSATCKNDVLKEAEDIGQCADGTSCPSATYIGGIRGKEEEEEAGHSQSHIVQPAGNSATYEKAATTDIKVQSQNNLEVVPEQSHKESTIETEQSDYSDDANMPTDDNRYEGSVSVSVKYDNSTTCENRQAEEEKSLRPTFAPAGITRDESSRPQKQIVSRRCVNCAKVRTCKQAAELKGAGCKDFTTEEENIKIDTTARTLESYLEDMMPVQTKTAPISQLLDEILASRAEYQETADDLF